MVPGRPICCIVRLPALPCCDSQAGQSLTRQAASWFPGLPGSTYIGLYFSRPTVQAARAMLCRWLIETAMRRSQKRRPFKVNTSSGGRAQTGTRGRQRPVSDSARYVCNLEPRGNPCGQVMTIKKISPGALPEPWHVRFTLFTQDPWRHAHILLKFCRHVPLDVRYTYPSLWLDYPTLSCRNAGMSVGGMVGWQPFISIMAW
jgi:hypothetical protein